MPVPPVLIEHLDLAYALRQHQFKPQLDERLWQYSRVTAWRKIKPILDDSGIKFPLAVPNSYFSLASGKFWDLEHVTGFLTGKLKLPENPVLLNRKVWMIFNYQSLAADFNDCWNTRRGVQKVGSGWWFERWAEEAVNLSIPYRTDSRESEQNDEFEGVITISCSEYPQFLN